MRPITRITTAETNSAIPSYMIFMYSQKIFFFIEDITFVTVARAKFVGPPGALWSHLGNWYSIYNWCSIYNKDFN